MNPLLEGIAAVGVAFLVSLAMIFSFLFQKLLVCEYEKVEAEGG